MGNSSTSRDELAARAAYRAASGTSFGHTTSMRSTPRAQQTIHESVDPKRLNTKNERIRECLDSPEHPNTIPVFVGFDETGSMADAPRIIVDKLAGLKGLTLRAGLPDVQLCFGAYGDAENREVAPCQVGQFESGLEMEEWLNNLFLEGNGGGNGGETATLLLWWLGTHSRLDSLDKRGKKGYLFLTGDEIALTVSRENVEHYTGEKVEAPLTPEEAVRAALTHYEVFFFLVNNGSAKGQGSYNFWTKLLGQDNVMVLEDLDHIAEIISGMLAVREATVGLGDLTQMMSDEGVSSTAIELVSKTLATVSSGPGTIPVVASSDNDFPASSSSADFL